MRTSTLDLGRSCALLPVGDEATAPEEVTPAAPTFDAIYAETFAFVWRMARTMGVAEASLDDVVQEVFLVVHRRLGDYDPRVPVRRWLLGILHRVAADHRRAFRRKEAPCVPHDVDHDGTETWVSPNPAPCEDAENAEALRLAVALLDRLDPDKREVFVLAQMEQMTVPEIAACLGVNVNTVYARLRAARKEFDAAFARHQRSSSRPAPPGKQP